MDGIKNDIYKLGGRKQNHFSFSFCHSSSYSEIFNVDITKKNKKRNEIYNEINKFLNKTSKMYCWF